MDRKLPELFALRYIPCPAQKGYENAAVMEPPCKSRPKISCCIARSSPGGHRIASDGVVEGHTEAASDSGAGVIASDSPYTYSVADENPTQAGSQIAMDSNGSLSLKMSGAVFSRVHEERFSFSLQNTAHTGLFLALSSDSQYTVKGMRKEDMRDKSDSYWKYLFFQEIGGYCPEKCGSIVLQYYGNRFGPDPDKAPYYLVIEMAQDRIPVFRIGDQKTAKYCGRLGIIEH